MSHVPCPVETIKVEGDSIPFRAVAAGRTDHGPRLFEDDLDMARVLVELSCQAGRRWPGANLAKAADPALGLRHDLVGDHEDVVAL